MPSVQWQKILQLCTEPLFYNLMQHFEHVGGKNNKKNKALPHPKTNFSQFLACGKSVKRKSIWYGLSIECRDFHFGMLVKRILALTN
jgi:hypothetical protein